MTYLDFANFPYIHEPIDKSKDLIYIVKNEYHIWKKALNQELYFELDLYMTNQEFSDVDETYFL